MALGITIRRWHLILAAGMLLYNFAGDKYAKIEDKKAESSIVEKCENKDADKFSILTNPKDVGMYLSTKFGKEAPCDHAAEFAAHVLGKKGYGHLVGYGNGGYSHCMFVFKENGKWGAVDDGLYFKNGYLKPRFENVKKLLEYVGKNSEWGAFESVGLYKPTEIEMEKSLESLVDWKKAKEGRPKWAKL